MVIIKSLPKGYAGSNPIANFTPNLFAGSYKYSRKENFKMKPAKYVRQENRKYHYIYKITRFDNHYYYGRHSTDNLDDGYFGSCKRLWHSINYHGIEKHTKAILEYLPTLTSLTIRESQIVNETCLNEPLCLSLQLGGGGGFISEEHQRKASLAGRDKALTAMREIFKSGSEEAARRVKNSAATQKRMRQNGELTYTKRERNNITTVAATLAAATPKSREKKKKTFAERKHQQGEKNSNFGKRNAVINKDDKNKRIPLSKLDEYLNAGWTRGLIR